MSLGALPPRVDSKISVEQKYMKRNNWQRPESADDELPMPPVLRRRSWNELDPEPRMSGSRFN